jgi:phosphatase NudJ
LLVQERKHGQTWYLPAGRVEPGETFAQAAVRETREEAGIDVVLDGIYCVEHSPEPAGTARCRVTFAAHPAGDQAPKGHEDEHTIGAQWFTVDEMRPLALRGPELLRLFEDVERGAPAYPMSLLRWEGEPLVAP